MALPKKAPVTDTPRSGLMIPVDGVQVRWRLTAGALKEIKAECGASILTLIREGRFDEDTICAILNAGFRAGWREGDPELPDTTDVELGDLLLALEYIASSIGDFFGVNVPNLRAAVGQWANELLAGLAATTGTNSTPTEPGSEQASPASDSGV